MAERQTMKTDTLIDWLSSGAGPAPRAVALRRLTPAALTGLAASAALSLVIIGGIPAEMYRTPVPWMKMAYAGAVFATAGWLTARLGRPIASVVGPRRALIAVLAAMAVVAAVSVAATPAGERLLAVRGHSWDTCAVSVLGLSLPSLAGILLALRRLAPTRPRAAGLAAGLMAGALGALGYALACVETSPLFVAVWYTLGIGLTGLLGYLLGPRLLRW